MPNSYSGFFGGDSAILPIQSNLSSFSLKRLFYTNYGSTEEVTIELPSPVFNPVASPPEVNSQCYEVSVFVVAPYKVKVKALSGNSIRVGNISSFGGGAIFSSSIGSAIVLVSVSNNLWLATSVVGNWEVEE